MQAKRVAACDDRVCMSLISKAVTGSSRILTSSVQIAYRAMQQELAVIRTRYRDESAVRKEMNRVLLAGYYFQVATGLFVISLNVPCTDSGYGGHGDIDTVLSRYALTCHDGLYHDLMDRGMAFTLSPVSRKGSQHIADEFFFYGSGGWNMSRFKSFQLPKQESEMVYTALLREFY